MGQSVGCGSESQCAGCCRREDGIACLFEPKVIPDGFEAETLLASLPGVDKVFKSTSSSVRPSPRKFSDIAAMSAATKYAFAPPETGSEAETDCEDLNEDFDDPDTFKVELRREQGCYGIEVDEDDGVALVITAINHGQLQDWNRSHRRELQVRVGDRIRSVNNVTAEKPHRLFTLLCKYERLFLEIKRHSEFSVPLYREPFEKLGITVRKRDRAHTLLILEVRSGVVAEWNKTTASHEICVGDRIIEVNGFRGYACHLDNMLTAEGPLNLVLVRFQHF